MTKIQNDELYHYGILGMKWGIRRYQPYRITGPRKGGETGQEIGEAAKKTRKEKRAEKKAAKIKVKEEKKVAEAEKKAEKEAERLKAKKDFIVKSKSPGALARNTDLFTTAELRDLKERIELKERISELSKRKTDRVASYLKTTSDTLNTSISVYNSVAQLTNAYHQQHGNLTKQNYRYLVKADLKPPEDNTGTVKNMDSLLKDYSNIRNLSDQQVQDISKRLASMNVIESNLFNSRNAENLNKKP